MDKKPSSRQSSVPPKCSGQDSKKDNGGITSKYPKYASRRETPGAPKPRYDQGFGNRRPQSQKTRFVDKRPRARAYGDHGEEVGKEVVPGPEMGSVQAWGSKKGNMNHLLNFHFETGNQYRGNGHSRGAASGSYKGRNRGRKLSRYNKEQYLQANCQFIVSEGGDYSVHLVDPDLLVDWSCLEQVRLFSNETPSCPICLFPAVAAKITCCGHIYCFACILHYLSLDDTSWRKCPICYESIQAKDLKSVVVKSMPVYAAGQQITLRLMRRQKRTAYAMPAQQWQAQDTDNFSKVDDTMDMLYAKVLVASWEQVQDIVHCERTALECQLQDNAVDGLEASYIQAALNLLRERQETLNIALAAKEPCSMNDDTNKLDIVGDEVADLAEVFKTPAKVNQSVEYASAFSDEEVEVEDKSKKESSSDGETDVVPKGDQRSFTISESSEDLDSTVDPSKVTMVVEGEEVEVDVDEAAASVDLPTEPAEKETKALTDSFYFYQAEDGQHIYLHSVNARCLVTEYGSLQCCPPTITATVVQLDAFTMNQELRERLRFLGHLPLTCQFQVAEVELMPPVISPDTAALFADEVEKRNRQRARKQREDKRMSRQIQRMEMQENRKLGIDPTAVIVRSEFNRSAIECVIVPSAVSQASRPVPEGSETGSPGEDTLSIGSAGSEDGQTSLSFAKMLQLGKARSTPSWEGGSDNTSKGNAVSHLKAIGDGSDDDNGAPAPTYQDSFGTAIQAALDNYTSPANDVPKDATKGKKKKKQKKLLFSTSLPRAK